MDYRLNYPDRVKGSALAASTTAHLKHPDSHLPWSQWQEDQILHVVVAYSNPFRWQTRRRLANDCIRHLRNCANVRLFLVELAYGDRPFEVSGGHPDDIQLRTTSELFHKEDLWSIGVSRFPVGWKYGGCVDADWHFTRHDWAIEAIHQLQHYEWLQPFSSYADLSGNVYGQKDIPLRLHSSFFFNYIQNGCQVSPQYHNGPVPNGKIDDEGYEGAMLMRGVGATGGAICFRHSAFQAVGGLLNRCILGHADWYMAYSLVGMEPPDIHTRNYHSNYKHYVNTWRTRAEVLKRNVGYVDGFAVHYFHGSKTRRAYSSRDIILAEYQYDPYVDVFPDPQGVLQLTPDKPNFRDAIRRYFISRFEDDPNLYGRETLRV